MYRLLAAFIVIFIEWVLEIWYHFWTPNEIVFESQLFDYLVTEKYWEVYCWVTYTINISYKIFYFHSKIILAVFSTYVGYFLFPFSSSCSKSLYPKDVVLYPRHLILLPAQMDNPEHPVPDQGIPRNSSKDLGSTGDPSNSTRFVQVGFAQIMECIHVAYEKYVCISVKL